MKLTNCLERSERVRRTYWSTYFLERSDMLRTSFWSLRLRQLIERKLLLSFSLRLMKSVDLILKIYSLIYTSSFKCCAPDCQI